MVLLKVLPSASLADQRPGVCCVLNGLLYTCSRVLVVTFENVVGIMGAIVHQVVPEVLFGIRPFARVVALWTLGNMPLWRHCLGLLFFVSIRFLEALTNRDGPDSCKTFDCRSTALWRK